MRLRRVSGWLLIPVGLAFFLLLGRVIEPAKDYRALRAAVQSPSVPTALLNRGSMGSMFRRLRLMQPVLNDGKVYPQSALPKTPLDASLFQKKRVVGEALYAPNPFWMEDVVARPDPACPEVSPDQFRNGWPLLAINVDEEDLTGKRWGIVRYSRGHGREWERRAHMAYYVDGRKVFSTPAGLRLHGGMSRMAGQTHSYRLHFRDEYGAPEFKRGLLFTPANEPIRRLVVHNDWPESHPFAGLLAFDLAERIGCTVPRTQPVVLVMNGVPQTNIFWLSEHVGRTAWANRVRHNDLLMYIMKGAKEPESFQAYGSFHIRMLGTPPPLDLAAVENEVDLDNLSAHILAVVYGGTSDGFQGAAVMDPRAEKPRWSWVTWDMDHSLWDIYGDRSQREPWQKESWERAIVFRGDAEAKARMRMSDARAMLFTRLMDECPDYRIRFIRYATDMLNHRLTEAFVLERIAHYEQLARAFGRTDFAFAEDYRGFARHRPALLREGMQQNFGAGELHRVEVRASAGTPLKIDGFEEIAPYVGFYFDGQTVRVEAPGFRHESPVNGDVVLEVPPAS